MNRLSWRLTAAILLTTLLAVGLVAVVTNQAAGSEFRRYLAGNNSASAASLAPDLVAYYRQTGNWEGLAGSFSSTLDSFGMGMGMGGRGRGAIMGHGVSVLVADAGGQVVYDSQDRLLGSRLSAADRTVAFALMDSGQTIGYVLVIHGAGSQLEAPEQAFLDRVNQALLLAAGLAGLLGIIIGTLLARTLAAPLGRLAQAAQAIAAGDLSQRVPESGAVETQIVAQAFNHMAQNLEQAETLRRNLMADVAHELRTPLTVIQGNLQALLEGVYPLEQAEIATIYDETRLLNRLVTDLRELAQAEAGQLQLELRPTDLAAILAQGAAGFSAAADAKQIALQLEVAPDLPLVMVDPDRLAQVLHNLLANALRHVAVGGQVSIRAGQFVAGPATGPATIRIEVADNGPGIASHELPHVFDRFWRSDRARSRDSGGSGLGLAIARHLVEAQGGRIGVESEEGQGTRFWVELVG